jgi:nitrite reductase/ring-hydroxylating ferredoxin subunit
MSAMAEVAVCATQDVPENSVISLEVGDERVAIYNIKGTFYATEARCTHAMADLAEGTLDGEEIECSFHFGKFHVPSGKPTEAPCFVALKTYRTAVRDGQVFIELDQPAATAA